MPQPRSIPATGSQWKASSCCAPSNFYLSSAKREPPNLGLRITGCFHARVDLPNRLIDPESYSKTPPRTPWNPAFCGHFLLKTTVPRVTGAHLDLNHSQGLLKTCERLNPAFLEKWRMTADPFPFTSGPRETIANLQFVDKPVLPTIESSILHKKPSQIAEIKRAVLKAAFKPTILGWCQRCEGVSRRENSQLDNS